MSDIEVKERKSITKSKRTLHRELNAKKAKLSDVAATLYMNNVASLSKAEQVAKSGREGRGYHFDTNSDHASHNSVRELK